MESRPRALALVHSHQGALAACVQAVPTQATSPKKTKTIASDSPTPVYA